MEIFDREPDLRATAALIFLHAMLILAIVYWWRFTGFYTISWILAGIFMVGGGLGVTIMYHRGLTHKSFTCNNVYIKRALMYFAGLLQNASSWVPNHWGHHAYTDTPLDPHSPYWPYHGRLRGWWWSHIGWLSWKYVPPKHLRNHQDLQNKDIVWENKWHILFVASGFFIPFIIGGLYGLVIGDWKNFIYYGVDSFFLAVISRTAMLHITLSINSFGHMIGWHARSITDRLFKTDSSRNNPLLATVSFGEGNHGDHHKFPSSARIGFWDPSWPVILFFEKLGIFREIHRPPRMEKT